MNTIKKISGGVAIIAFVLALPVAAEEQISTKLKEHSGFQPVATKRAMPTRTSEAPSRKVIEAALPATPSNEPTSSADSMPYVTYDGASNSQQ